MSADIETVLKHAIDTLDRCGPVMERAEKVIDKLVEALKLCEERHALLLKAHKLPVSDMTRWQLSLRVGEITKKLKEIMP